MRSTSSVRPAVGTGPRDDAARPLRHAQARPLVRRPPPRRRRHLDRRPRGRLGRRRVRRVGLPGHVQAQRHPELRRAAPAAGVGAEGRRRQRTGRVRGRRGHGPRCRGAAPDHGHAGADPGDPGRRRGAVALRRGRSGADLTRRAHRLRGRAAREGVDQLRAAGVQGIIDAVRSDAGDGLRIEVLRPGRAPVGPAEPQQHRHRRRRRARRAAARLRLGPRRRDAAPRSRASRSGSRSASPGCSPTSSRSRRSRRSCRC